MVNEKYVQDYVHRVLTKHEEHGTRYGMWFLCLVILNEMFLLWLIFSRTRTC